MILKNGLVLDDAFEFKKLDIEITDDKISAASENLNGLNSIDISGKCVIPGLIDIHTHGVLGTDACSEDYDYKLCQKYYNENGVTTFFPTTVSAERQALIKSLKKLGGDAEVIGINLEGPYLSPAKAGAHDKSVLKNADICDFDELIRASSNKIKVVTVAPEEGDNIEFIRKVKEKYGVVVSLGHSAADYETALRAIEAGATHLTHTFNAMNGLNHREPSLVGAALENDRVFCEVISDGVHLHPCVVKLLYKILGSSRMVLISDCMSATGLCDGEYTLGGMKTTVKGGVARTEEGNIAGSTKNLMDMVRCAVQFGIPTAEAVKMATITPARAVGLDKDYGSITAGKFADLVVCDNQLNIDFVIKNGKIL